MRRRAKRRAVSLAFRIRFFNDAVRSYPTLSEVRVGRRTLDVLAAPEILSLTNNLESTLGFIYAARRLLYRRHAHPQRPTWRLDFEPIQHIGPAAALVLAAELDRWTHIRGRPPRPMIDTWQPYVQTAFHDLGLLPLLGLPQYSCPIGGRELPLRFLPFRRGNLTQGEDAASLRRD